MGALSDVLNEQGFTTIADFICPTDNTRENFGKGIVIWLDTIKEGRFDDTNKLFVIPKEYDFKVTTQDAKKWALEIATKLLGENNG